MANMANHRFLHQFLPLLLVLGAGLEASKQTTTDDGNIVFDAAKDDLRMSLRFEPPEIDFGHESVGIARSHKVTLVNENVNRSVYLSSVSGRTPIFFASFMDTRVIAPRENTTFDVVFLPRKSVLATDTLLVHTSFGQARLLVRGRGLSNAYRLKPIVGIKAPLNALLTPEIYMYNPHELPLQIIEIYSSGGQFQLELPSGLSSAPQALWEIPPHTTKPIIRIKFQGNNAGNHSAFIRIKIATQSSNADNNSQSQPNTEDVLVVPVEFEIFAEQGIYTSNPVLDFGRLTNAKPKNPIKLKLKLQNSDEQNSIEDVSIISITSDTLPPGLHFKVSDGGSLTLNTELYNMTTTIDELVTLQVKSKDNTKPSNTFTVRVRADIFKGNLHFNRNASIFVSGTARTISTKERTLRVRNDFEEPIVLYNVSFETSNQKSIHIDYATNFPQLLQPGQIHDLLHLNLKDERLHFNSSIRILTNITDVVELPLVVCTGRLHVTTYHEPLLKPELDYNTELNMGAVPLEEMSRDGFIALQNPNPISVRIVNWNFKSPHGVYFHTTSLGCLSPTAHAHLKANKSIAIESANFRFCSALSEGDIMVFQIAIQSYITDLQMATLQIWTPHETITTTVVFHTWTGKLEVDQEELYFKNCFPGKVCSSDLSIRSTFQNPIHITAINFTDDSIRFPSDESKKLVFALTPNAVTRLGRIYFEPALHCNNRCYLPHDEKLNNLAFPLTSHIENNNFHFDDAELRRRTALYRQMKRHFRMINFMLTSRELRQVQLQAIIDIKWPKLVVEGAQKMATIEAGKFQEHSIHITNPSDRPILIDYFLANPSYAQKTKLSLPVEVVDMSSTCYLTDQAVFTLKAPLKKPLILPPHASVDVWIRFDAPPQLTDTYCTLLHIRNNLTLYEAVWLSAKSVQSQFRFGNRKPGVSTPLIYEIHEKHLAACQHQQPVIAKRSFTARNTGEVPIRIDLFMIGDQICEGYGFKVLGCGNGGFELKANESRKIEIAFRPDFTQFRVTQTLSILTNLSYGINYTLFGQLPTAEMLRQCTDIQPRPMWEKHIRISGVILLLTSFVLVLAAANVDAENIGNAQSALYAAREKGAVQPTFNLRNIAIKANQSNSKCNKTNNSTTNSNGNHRAQNKMHNNNNHNNNGHHQQQQQLSKTTRRRLAASAQSSGNSQRKYSTTPESTTPDANDFNCDEKFALEFDESNCWQESYDCSPSSSSNANSFKSSPSPPKCADERAADVLGKKQRQASTVGKSKNSNRRGKCAQSTPPPTRNPIIELMDKEVGQEGGGYNATKCPNSKSPPTLLKRLTESIAAAVSSKERTRPVEKSRVEKLPKAQRTEEKKTQLANDFWDDGKSVQPFEQKNEAKVDAISNQHKTTAVNDSEMQQSSKPKTQDFPTNAFKQRSVECSSLKSTNYVGPIRNMETYQSQKLQTAEVQQAPPKMSFAITEHKPSVSPIKTFVEAKNRDEPAIVNSMIPPPIAAVLPENKPLPSSALAVNSAVVKPMNFNNLSVTTQPHKYGKTPGRERSKDNSSYTIYNNNNNNKIATNGHSNEQKLPTTSDQISKNKVIKTLNFDEDNYSYPSMGNQKFASERQLRPLQTTITPIHVDSEKGALYIDLNAKRDNCTESNSNILPPENSNIIAQSISNIFKESTAQVQQQKGSELGPIGTKKSPSSTPAWESVVGSAVGGGGNTRAPLQPKVMDANNSFFSTLPTVSQAKLKNAIPVGDATNFDFNAAQSILDNVTPASFYEMKKKEAHLQRQLEAKDFLLHLRSQQLEEERRQRQHQQELLKSITQWPRTSDVTTTGAGATWGPIGGYAGNSVSMGFSESIDGKKSLTPTLDQFDAWPLTSSTSTTTTAAAIRPPPGLGVTMPTPPGLAQQQQQQRQQNNNIISNNIANNNMNNSNTNLQKDDGVRTFDPFSSLGSIWSDSWKPKNTN